MKKVIDGVASGPVNLVLCEILASFIFVSCIMEKGLWYANVNENYFHVATAAQDRVRCKSETTGSSQGTTLSVDPIFSNIKSAFIGLHFCLVERIHVQS